MQLTKGVVVLRVFLIVQHLLFRSEEPLGFCRVAGAQSAVARRSNLELYVLLASRCLQLIQDLSSKTGIHENVDLPYLIWISGVIHSLT